MVKKESHKEQMTTWKLKEGTILFDSNLASVKVWIYCLMVLTQTKTISGHCICCTSSISILSLSLNHQSIFSGVNRYPSVFPQSNRSPEQKHNQTALRARGVAVETGSRWSFKQMQVQHFSTVSNVKKTFLLFHSTKWKLSIFSCSSQLETQTPHIIFFNCV